MSIQFSDLPAAGSVNPTDELAVDQNGVTRRATAQAIANLAPAPASGLASPLIIHLTAIGAASFNGTLYHDWTGITDRASVDAHWDQATQTVIFDTEAYYRVEFMAKVATAASADWPGTGVNEKATLYGSKLPGAVGLIEETQYAKSAPDPLDVPRAQVATWTDVFQYQAVLPDSIQPNVYASFYAGGAGVGAVFSGTLTVTRIGA